MSDKEFICMKCHRVFMGGNEKCCGDVEIFSPEIHAKMLIGSSNAWISVWEWWKTNRLLIEISQELTEDGCCGTSTHLNEFIKRLITGKA